MLKHAPDKWMFEFEPEPGKAEEEKAGQSLELLKSAALEKLVDDAKTRVEARYRLWGKVTKFEGKNYIFATYFLALRKTDKPAEQQVTKDAARQALNTQNDILNIPDEIVAKLRTSEVLPTTEAQEPLQLKQDTIFANRVGRVVAKNRWLLYSRRTAWGAAFEKFAIKVAALPEARRRDCAGAKRIKPGQVQRGGDFNEIQRRTIPAAAKGDEDV